MMNVIMAFDMQHSSEEWFSLCQRLKMSQDLCSRLQEQNRLLKEQLTSIQHQRQIPNHHRPSLPAEFNLRMTAPPRMQLVEELSRWSSHINDKMRHLAPSELSSPSFSVSTHMRHLVPSQLSSPPASFPTYIQLLEDICLFGPSEEALCASTERRFTAPHHLFHSAFQKDFNMYGTYIFPEQLSVKRIKATHLEDQTDKVIFKKRFKQTDCNIIAFRERDDLTVVPNQTFLKQINPPKILYAITIAFSDLMHCEKPVRSIQESWEQRKKNERIIQYSKQYSNKQNSARNKSEQQVQEQVTFKSNFCLCVLTYFPFISFFTRLLINVLNEIKIHRLQQYSKSKSSVSHMLTPSYLSGELRRILQPLLKKISEFQPSLQSRLEVCLNSQVMVLSLRQENLIEELYSDWAAKILQQFDKDSLYELYTRVILEESVVFLCEDTHLLTFTIMLFTSMLTRPYSYPYPRVSLVFDEQVLQSPFTVVLGLPKSSNWLKENLAYMHSLNKVIVDINEDDVKYKKTKVVKSEKLKKIFAHYYKRSEAGKPHFHTLLRDIENYYQDELEVYLPNKEIIRNIQCNQQEDNRSVLVLKTIEKYLAENKKDRLKDPFIQAFVQKQIFYVYLNSKYDIS